MGRVIEHQAKELLRRAGLPAPEGAAAATPEAARAIAARLGRPVVVKALVPMGKRGKAGAVKFAADPDGAAAAAAQVLGMCVGPYPVDLVLVEERLDIARELYCSFTIDKGAMAPVLIFASAGGIDIEAVAARHPDRLVRHRIDPMLGLMPYEVRRIWFDLGLPAGPARQAADLLCGLFRLFAGSDAYLLEINPLVITGDGRLLPAAAVMSVDDAAMFRHPELEDVVQVGSEKVWRPLTPLEIQGLAVNKIDAYRGSARYIELEGGDIAFLCGGGGGSLLLFDAIQSAGGRPANYSEFGGNPTENKVVALCNVVLSKPGVRGLFVGHNITNNTQVDVVARGIVASLQANGRDPATFPVLVREAGVNDVAGRRTFEEFGIEYHGDDVTMSAAARLMVEKMRRFYGEGR